MQLQIFFEFQSILNTVCLWTFPKCNKHWNYIVIRKWVIFGIMFNLEKATKTQMGSLGIALLYLRPRRCRKWVVNATPRPHYPPRKRPSTHCIADLVGHRAGWTPGENLASYRDSIPGQSSP
jgi:hypothetical protein